MSEPETIENSGVSKIITRQMFRGWAGILFAGYCLFTLSHVLYTIFHWGGDENATLISNIVSFVLYVGPCIFAWRTSASKDLNRRSRWAWAFIALANTSYMIGSGLWLYFESYLGEQPFPSLADVGYLGFFPMMLVGLLMMVEPMKTAEERLGFVLDLAIIMTGGTLVIWYFLLQPIVDAGDGFTLKTILSVAYPVGDLVLLLGIVSILLKRRTFAGNAAVNMVLAGVMMNFVADFIFGYQSLKSTYQTGTWVDGLYTMASLPVALGAHYRYLLGSAGYTLTSSPSNMARRMFLGLPYLAVLISFGVLIEIEFNDTVLSYGVDIIVATLLTVLILARQFIFVSENLRTSHQLSLLQKRIQSIYSASTDGIAVANRDGQLLELNDAFSRMVGYTRCELLSGITILDLTPSEFAPATSKAWEVALTSEEPVEYEKEYLRQDGTRFIASVTVFPVGKSNGSESIAAIVHDITERKNTEIRLREAEERWQLALRVSRDGIWDWDVTNNKSFYSESWRKMLGWDIDETVPFGFGNAVELFHPDDKHLFHELLETFHESSLPYFDIEFRHLCKDGSYKWVRCRAEPKRNEITGGLERLIGLNTDIEEKKRADIEREVIGNILQGVSETANLEELLRLIHREIGRVIYAENCFVALYEKSSKLFKMQFFVDKFDDVPRAATLEGTRSHYVFRTGKPLFLDSENTSEMESKGAFTLVGSSPKFWLGTPLKTPSEVMGVLVVQSYDEQHTYTEQDLDFLTSVAGTIALAIERKQTENRMLLQTAALESASNGVVITDNSGRIEWVNPAFSRLTGYSLEESIGKDPRILKSGQTTEDVYGDLWTTITQGRVWQGELLNRRKDGELYNEEMTITPVTNSDGEMEHFVAIKRDITERKVAEHQLKVFNEKLQQSNRELQDFAYVASHDLQEPLRKVQTFADRLGSKYSASLDETGLDYLQRMRSAAGRMQTLIQDLLAFSRVTTKAQPFVQVDLEQITQEVLSDLEVKIEETGAVVEIDGLPRIDADPMQMRQLIQNLVGNALKFRRNDVAPLVRITAEKACLGSYGNGNGAFSIKVEDNGIGFDEKYTDKIFTVFQRLHGRTEYEGSGIGLAVCRKIVERHHGNITAHSTPGRGSQFVFTLPGHQTHVEVNK